jgi:hypothetical protein
LIFLASDSLWSSVIGSAPGESTYIQADLIVVLDRTSATRIAEIRLPQGLYSTIDSLDVFGDLILINIYDSTTEALGKPILMSFNGTSTTLDTVGAATFDQ